MAYISESLEWIGIKNMNCRFCGEETTKGGYWDCASFEDRHILVCNNCKDVLLHLYIDTCMDGHLADIGHMGMKLNSLYNTSHGRDYKESSDEQIIVDYVKNFVMDEIAKKKASNRKQRRYNEYLRLKAEFED